MQCVVRWTAAYHVGTGPASSLDDTMQSRADKKWRQKTNGVCRTVAETGAVKLSDEARSQPAAGNTTPSRPPHPGPNSR